MSQRIWIWGILTFPLALLRWLHQLYVSILPFLGRDRALDALWRDLRNAETFEEWEKAGLALDHHYNIDYWRRDDKSKDYAWQLISERLGAFALALERGNIQALVNLLQSGLVRNLGNITVPKLYNVSFAGTKYLIENYILQVCEVISDLAALPPNIAASPGGLLTGPVPASTVASLHSLELARAVVEGRCKLRSPGQKKVLFNNLRQSFGQSTLVLQGGSIFGLCHLGVARALFLRGLLPRVITGTGTGALIAALVGIHTEEELPGILSGEKINLEAFTAWTSAGEKRPTAVSFRVRLATLRRRVARFWNEGYFLDVRVLEQLVRDNGGDLTFEEAYQRTGRVLNITVVAGGEGEVPSVLNYVTAPNVLIWSAAIASNASDATWYGRQKTQILCKDARGETSLWPLADAVHFRHWSHGSTQHGARHPPLQRVAQLFNVNHFIVSQSRPYLVPFLQPSMHSPDMRGLAMSSLARLKHYLLGRAAHGIRHRLQQLSGLGYLPNSLRRLLLDETLPGAEHLVLVPRVPWRDYGRLLDAPSRETLRYWIRKGEKSVWPAVAALKIRCSVELAIRDAVEANLSESERRKRSTTGLAKMRGR